MRRESGIAREKVHRPGGGLLQGESLKVVNMLDLARELSGEPSAQAAANDAQGTTPAEFWKKRLSGFSGATPVPVTIAAPNPAAIGAGIRSHTVEHEMLAGAAGEIGIPLHVLLTASWALLLHRYNGEDDITYGVVKSCIDRGNEAEAHIVPARVGVLADSPVGAWLRDIAQQSRETAPFEFTSLPQVRLAAGLPADAALFHTVVSVGNEFDPMSIVASRSGETDKYPLVAAVYPGQPTTLTIAFSKGVFAEEAINTMLGHWSMLLQSIAATPNARIATLRIITPEEEKRVTVDWNDTTEVYARQLTVAQLFEAQVERTPSFKAVEFGEISVTYAEFNQRANQLAHHLRELGVGADSVVGICMERSIEAVLAVLAVLKAGAAYLPLDPSYPHERLSFMLADARARVLITQKQLDGLFPNVPQQVIFLEERWFEESRHSRENPAVINQPDSLAYLIYTSGSTGKPKGVAMIQRPLVNLIDWQVKNSGLQAGEKTLQFTSLSFDVSFQELFATWCSGGTLSLITAELRLSPRELWQFIVRQKIARIFLPFVALQQLADAAAAEKTAAGALREVVTAGEQLQVTPRLRELFARHPNATLHNHYGPSETHVVTALQLQGDPESWPALPSIGRPIQNTTIYLLDAHRTPVPVGIPGELFIGGDALARGYFERPEVTAEKFVPDLFSKDTGARLYRTGDLARYVSDGNIEFLGRIDHQVKIRGYRVELGEVESAIAKLPGVRECVVVARERDGGLKQLVGYVVPEPGITLQAQSLRQQLKHGLPEYMVPSAFVFLDKLPLTPSGKVDRRSLPAPDETQTAAAPSPATGEKPWLPIQLQLVQLWEEMLGVKPVGMRDNFFDLGGHSILAVRMMDRVEQVTGKKLPVTELFNDATIAHLSELIVNAPEQAPSPVIELRREGSRTPLYFLHGDIIGGGFYARDLARLMGPDQPFYVLPPSEMQSDLTTVEEMAETHLADLRAHRPHGPYVLGGFCIGALVAYEMAVRLRAQGEDVPWLALIDPQLASPWLRAYFRATEKLAASRRYSDRQKLAFFAKGHKVLYRLREEWQSPLRHKFGFVSRKTKALLGFNGNVKSAVVADPDGVRGEQENGRFAVDPLFEDREQQILAAFHWILSAYTPPSYDGKLTMFLTDEQYDLTPFLERKWRKAAPNLEVQRVAGKHLEAITTEVESFAGKIRERLFANVSGPNVPA